VLSKRTWFSKQAFICFRLPSVTAVFFESLWPIRFWLLLLLMMIMMLYSSSDLIRSTDVEQFSACHSNEVYTNELGRNRWA